MPRPLIRLLPLILVCLACSTAEDLDPGVFDPTGLRPRPLGGGRYLFTYRDQYRGAESVHLIGNFRHQNRLVPRSALADPDGDNAWSVEITIDPGVYYYKFLINNRLLVVPQGAPAYDRSMHHAGQLFVPNTDAPYLVALSPPDEALVSNLEPVSFRIQGNRGALDEKSLRVTANGTACRLSRDEASGHYRAVIDSPQSGQYFLQITGQDSDGNELLEYQSVFYYYPTPRRTITERTRAPLAYRVLIPALGEDLEATSGTLRTLLSRLDYLNNGKNDGSSLGVRLLILHSVNAAADPWGRETLDFRSMRSAVGSESDFQALAGECRKRGILLLVHYNLAYISNRHSFFQEAFGNPASRRTDWFFFLNDQGTRYLSYADNPALPRLNGNNAYVAVFALEHLWNWIRLGAAGFYLDHADLVANRLLRQLQASIRGYNANVAFAAQDVGRGGQNAYFADNDFSILEQTEFAEQWALAFAGEDPAPLFQFMTNQAQDPPAGTALLRPTMAPGAMRIASLLRNPARLEAAYGFLLTSGGIPLLAWGDELGLESPPPPLEDSPSPMPWARITEQSRNPRSLLSLVRRLVQLREEYPELSNDTADGRPLLFWNTNRKKGWLAFLRRSTPDRLFIGLLAGETNLTALAPEFQVSGLAPGTWEGQDALLPGPKRYRLDIPADGEAKPGELPMQNRGFQLYKFEKK